MEKGVHPATPAPSKVSASPGCGAPDLSTVEGLESEQARLYSALGSEGFSRAVALQLSVVTKALGALQESGCADHYEEEDMQRVCMSLNDAWLRQLEIASRDLAQVGHTDATRILDRAIEKVRVEAEILT